MVGAPSTLASPAAARTQPLLGLCAHAAVDLAVLLALAIGSWWLQRRTGWLPLPTQTLLLGMLFGLVCRRVPKLQGYRPAAEVPLTVGMVLLGAQVDADALRAIGLAGLLLLLLHQVVVGWCVRTPLRFVGVAPRTASLVAVGVGGGSLSAVLAAESAATRPDDVARQQAITSTLFVGAIGFLAQPPLVAALGLDATQCARWAGITMPTTAEAVLVAAGHSPEALRATGAMRFLVSLLLWIPVLAHLRRVEPAPPGATSHRARTVWLAVRRVPGFVFGLGLLAMVTLLGGVAPGEQAALARATNWAFLMVLAGVGMTLRPRSLQQLGLRPLLAATLGWAAAAAWTLSWVRLP